MKKLSIMLLMLCGQHLMANGIEDYPFSYNEQQNNSSRTEMMMFDTGSSLKMHYNFYDDEQGEFINVVMTANKKSQSMTEIIVTSIDGQLLINEGITHFFSHSINNKSFGGKDVSIDNFFANLPLDKMESIQTRISEMNKAYTSSQCTNLQHDITYHMQAFFRAKRVGDTGTAEGHMSDVRNLMIEFQDNC